MGLVLVLMETLMDPCWSLLVIGHLLLLVIMGLVLVLMETVMDPVGLYW